MLDYKLLEALSAVTRMGSFEKAAVELSVTQSAVSQRVKLLEQRVGRFLLIRTSPVQATEEGQKLLRHVQQVQLLEKELASELVDEADTGFSTIRLAVNADSLATWLPDALGELFRTGMLLELEVDDQDVTLEHLRSGQVMGAISSRGTALQGCSSEKLGVMRYITVATPTFIDEFCNTGLNSGLNSDSLRKIPTVLYGRDDELQNRFLKRYFDLDAGQFPAHILPAAQSFIDAARQGMAYALVPELQAAPQLNSGELVEMMPGKYLDVALYWHCWNLQPAMLRIVADNLRVAARNCLRN
ncbi:MAG: LysR family transcriptional regulator ArgP [Endozoicomonas sp.]